MEVWSQSAQDRPGLVMLIKGVHTLIFASMLAAIGWLVVSGFQDRRDRSVGVAAAMVAGEIGVFVANRGICPLTPLAERYGANSGSVSDIYLPDAVARTIPVWSSALLVLAAILHVRGHVRKYLRPRGTVPAMRVS